MLHEGCSLKEPQSQVFNLGFAATRQNGHHAGVWCQTQLLAGCRLVFENPSPGPDPLISLLTTRQDGATGDMTGSRKSRIPTVKDDELLRLLDAKLPVPTRVANCLYLEWFSESNGRVVLESTDFRLEVTVPQWSMTAEEEKLQTRESQENFHAYLDSITGASLDDEEEDDDPDDDDDFEDDDEDDEEDDDVNGFRPAPPGDDDEEEEDGMSAREGDEENMIETIEEEPLDEFEWEQELREADRRAEAYQEAFDRYRDHPNRERLIAEAMNWEPEEVEEFRDDWQDVTESLQPHAPEDLIEAADSFSQDDENAHHPLSRRAMEFALRLQSDAKLRGLMNPETPRESPVLSVIVSVIALGCKLAAALDGTMHGFDPEPGFVIAMLKRSQIPLNEGLHALSSIEMSGLPKDTRDWLSGARNEMFELRKDILDLMRELRMR